MTPNEREQMRRVKRRNHYRLLIEEMEARGLPALRDDKLKTKLIRRCMKIKGDLLDTYDFRVLYRLVLRGLLG